MMVHLIGLEKINSIMSKYMTMYGRNCFFFFFEFLLMVSSLDDCSLTLDQDVN